MISKIAKRSVLLFLLLACLICVACGLIFSATNVDATEIAKTEILPIARYEFKDSTNLGKDSMGNFDLETYGTALTNGGNATDGYYLNFADEGCLYAPVNSSGKDFSDYLTGSFTISFGLNVDFSTIGYVPIISATNGIYVTYGQAREGFALYGSQYIYSLIASLSNGQEVDETGKAQVTSCSASVYGKIDNTKFHNVVVTCDKANTKLYIYVDGVLLQSFDEKVILGTSAFSFAIGTNWNNIQNCSCDGSYVSTGSIKDVRIYDFALDSQNVSDLSSGNAVYLNSDTEILTEVTATAKITTKVDPSLTDSEILALKDILPSNVSVKTNKGNTISVPVIYTGVERKDSSATVKGALLGAVSNIKGLTFTTEIPFLADSDKGEIKPIARYEFKDVENLGKDSMGNFDLDEMGIGMVQGEDGKSLNFDDNFNGYLRARNLGNKDDFSDYLSSFTVSLYIKKDITNAKTNWETIIGAGGYDKGLSIQGANGNLYAFIYNEKNKYASKMDISSSLNADTYAFVTVTYEASADVCSLFVNGNKVASVADCGNGMGGSGDFVFSIGANSQLSDNSFSHMSAGSIKDVRIYDFALSSQNIIDIMKNDGTDYSSTLPTKYISKIANIDRSDNVITGTNTVADVINGLSKTVDITLNDGTKLKAKVSWHNDAIGGKIIGIISSNYANISGTTLKADLKYLQEFDIDDKKAITNVKVNGSLYSGDYKLNGGDKLSFEISDGYSLKSVLLNGKKLTADDNGVYTITVSGYNKITVDVSINRNTIKYNTDTEDGIVYKYYSAEDTITLLEVTKEGYTFDGWYTNADFSGERITSIDTSKAEDIELFAKFTQNENEEKSGCGASIGINMVLVISLFAVGAVLIKKRKSN